MRKSLFVIALILTSSLARASGIAEQLGLSSFWDWKQIETEHFRLTFPAELSDTALKAANDLEEAHKFLSKELYWEAHYKVAVMVIDNADAANGETSATGRFGMVLWVTPPDNWFSTAYYDDWLRLLVIHEYSHFLNMDATHGFWETGRYLFGDVALPNTIWPSWMLEGLAVYNETRYTHSGRGRSPYYEMIIRAGVESETLDTDKFVTLDRLGASSPYFPGGENWYLFGYHLWDEAVVNNKAGPTADQDGTLKSGQDVIGVDSLRSGNRFPFFINGNLENITGRDWYSYWNQWVKEAYSRGDAQLAKIKSQPVTPIHRLTEKAYEVLGNAFSPDGNWLAYTAETLDDVTSLYLKNLKTGEIKIIGEKTLGAQICFTPDSKNLLISSLRRSAEYYDYSEIGVYSIENGSTDWLSYKLRARDPNVSPDGKWVVFTMTETSKTGLGIAPIIYRNGKLRLGAVQRFYNVEKYDVASSPRFSHDGKMVFFSLHHNGQTSEEIYTLDVASKKAKILVKNGHFNRYPTLNSKDDLYFVSDITGVDNLFLYRAGANPKQVTNVTTGITFPNFSPQDELYAASLSYTGWDLAKLDLSSSEISSDLVTIPPPIFPAPDADSDAKNSSTQYKVEDYSIFPSIWPRGWIPFLYGSAGSYTFGEAVLGFDATDRHRYELQIGSDNVSWDLDWQAQYQNRSYGVTFTLAAEDLLTNTIYNGNEVYYYSRDLEYIFGASYPFMWTYSSLTPSIFFTLDQTSYATPSGGNFFVTNFIPLLDTILSYSDAEQSPLAISAESGRSSQIGLRTLFDNGGTNSFKGLLTDSEYLELGKSHVVLVPSVQASYTSSTSNTNVNSNVIVQGRYPTIPASFPNSGLNSLPIHGYPGDVLYTKAAAITDLALKFPISYIFRGLGTDPLFFQTFHGFAFAEAAWFPFSDEYSGVSVLTSTGAGIISDLTALVQVPISITLEYDYGFRPEAFGTGDLFVEVGYSGAFF